mgnify:FL=1
MGKETENQQLSANRPTEGELKTFALFLNDMWKKHRKELYSNLYYTYHPDGDEYSGFYGYG